MRIIIFTYLLLIIQPFISQRYANLVDCNMVNDTTNPHKGRFIDSSIVGKVQLISFDYIDYLKYNHKLFEYPNTIKLKKGNLKEKKIRNFDFNKLEIDEKHIIELKTISDTASLNKLYSIFDYKYLTETFNTFGGMLCYFPRNAIVFYDKEGKLLRIFEICFECEHYTVYGCESDCVKYICKDDWRDLLDLFEIEGLSFGINKK
jgi:hypothetical protein